MEEGARGVRDPLIGTVLHERYRLLRRIGRGGMGIVYLAEHVRIGRKYAIKVLSERANATDEMVARFHREAVAAAAVGSDHVVEVTDMGQLEDGSYFLVLEYLEGAELAKLVMAEGTFDPGRAVKIVCQLCDALSAVHDKGIVHRDLKPENLFLIEHRGQTDFLKVLDFGVCKLLESGDELRDSAAPALTRTNASLGTPQYMAPEQFHASARVDHRADIHAVGAVLYFMLTGKPPFDAPTLAQLALRACMDPPPTLLSQRPELPAGLDAVIQRAMAKHPEDRYPTSAALKQALAPFLELRAAPGAAPITLPGPTGGGYATLPGEAPFSSSIADVALLPSESARAPALEAVSIRLPERRWPLWSAAVLLVGLVSLLSLWGATLLAGAKHEGKMSRPNLPVASAASRAAEVPVASHSSLAPRPVQPGPEEDAASLPIPASTSLKTPRKKASPAISSAPEALAPSAAPAEASATPAAPEPAPEPAPKRGDATYHFPKRALQDVF